MWQNIAVILIGCATVGVIVYRILRLFKRGKHPYNPCEGCSGCSLKGKMHIPTDRYGDK